MQVPRSRFRLRWVAAAGLIVASAASEASAQPPIPGIAAKAIEFQDLRDKTTITLRDMAAYAALLRQVKATKPTDLAERARRDVGFRELWDHPEDYRGVLVELRGFCRRTYSSESKLAARGKLYEVWITLPQIDQDLLACIVEKLPEGLPMEAAVSEPVVFHGFFLKLIAYDSGDSRRAAPLLIGRLDCVPGEKPADPLDEEQARRLPVGARPELDVAREGERFMLSLDRDGALALEDKPVAREDLTGKLARLAAQLQLSARAVRTPPDANGALPAVIVIRAQDETPCSTIFQLMLDCRGTGFVRFALKLPRVEPPADRRAETRAVPSTRNKENDLPAAIRTIPILLIADNRGRIAGAEVGELQHRSFDSLRAELTSILEDPELPFDRARISADPRLMCSEVIRVMELLTRRNVTTIEFGPIEPGDRSSSK